MSKTEITHEPSPQAVLAVPVGIPSALQRFFGGRQVDEPSSQVDLIRSKLQFDWTLPECRAYSDADDALYNHESGFYRYCASGFPLIFADHLYRAEWDAKRARLVRDERLAWRAAQRATAQALEARKAAPCPPMNPPSAPRSLT